MRSTTALFGLLIAAACAPAPEETEVALRDQALLETPAVLARVSGQAAARPVVHVWKSPTCGCCAAWVEHMRAAGFTVEVEDVQNIDQVKREQGVPRAAASCHTALVDGYLVEGHVPAATIDRMLAERPEIAGIAVPGMPVGSPGMEVPGMDAQPYQVVAFTSGGELSVYEEH